MKFAIKILSKNLEALLWLSGLIYLYNINPYTDGHLTFCGFRLIGIDNCPGCGLGRSISLFFHGDIQGSFDMHPLGIVALILIATRIISLLIKNFIKPIITEVHNGKRTAVTA